MSKGYLAAVTGGIGAGIVGGLLGGFLPAVFKVGVNPGEDVGSLAFGLAVVGLASVVGGITGLAAGSYTALKFKGYSGAGLTAGVAAFLTLAFSVVFYLVAGWISANAGVDLFAWLLVPAPILAILAARKLTISQ